MCSMPDSNPVCGSTSHGQNLVITDCGHKRCLADDLQDGRSFLEGGDRYVGISLTSLLFVHSEV